MKHLSEHTGDVQYQPVAFNADSTFLYYLTDEDYEFLYVKTALFIVRNYRGCRERKMGCIDRSLFS